MKNIMQEATLEIQNDMIGNTRTKAGRLLRSEGTRKDVFQKQICRGTIKETLLDKLFDGIYVQEFTSISDIIDDNTLIVFPPKSQSIFQINLENLTFMEMVMDKPNVQWKSQASWCNYNNGDILSEDAVSAKPVIE